MSVSKYSIVARVDYLKQHELLNLYKYMKDFEISRRTAFRDLELFNDLYNLNFIYDRSINLYRKIKTI